jgi:hypothetical protein
MVRQTPSLLSLLGGTFFSVISNEVRNLPSIERVKRLPFKLTLKDKKYFLGGVLRRVFSPPQNKETSRKGGSK